MENLQLETKQCSKCGEIKIFDEFYKTGNQCKECQRNNCRTWRENNREKYLAGSKRWRQKNYEVNSVDESTRKKFSNIVSAHTNGKTYKIRDKNFWLQLGYTQDEFIVHLESKFTPEMNWGNYGGKNGWQLDHIIPRKYFKYNSIFDSGFKECWALKNIQPLMRYDNLTKGYGI